MSTHNAKRVVWTCFTDGSSLSNPGPSGAAAVLVDKNFHKIDKIDKIDAKQNHKTPRKTPDKAPDKAADKPVAELQFSFADKTTNNVAELKGVELALTLFENHHKLVSKEMLEEPKAHLLEDKSGSAKGIPEGASPASGATVADEWHVFTDSRYARGLLELGWKAKENQSIVAALRSEMQRLETECAVQIHVHWVRAHNGNFWNEKVDKLARDAAKQAKAKQIKIGS